MKNEDTFEGVGGLKIATRYWGPKGAVRGIMILFMGSIHIAVILHGRPNSSPRTVSPPTLWTTAVGASRAASDGTSRSFRLLGDVDKLVGIARSENPGVPVYMLGHSVGGVITSSYVFEHQQGDRRIHLRELGIRCRVAEPRPTGF